MILGILCLIIIGFMLGFPLFVELKVWWRQGKLVSKLCFWLCAIGSFLFLCYLTGGVALILIIPGLIFAHANRRYP